MEKETCQEDKHHQYCIKRQFEGSEVFQQYYSDTQNGCPICDQTVPGRENIFFILNVREGFIKKKWK